MGKLFTIKLHSPGVKALLQDPKVTDLEGRAARIAAAAGEGMEADLTIGPQRARASVRTATPEAMVAEATNRDLTRAIDAGR